MILWWCNLNVSLLLGSKYILENEPKKPKPVHQNWLRQTTQTITKTDHAQK